jgi:hypothetical protein
MNSRAMIMLANHCVDHEERIAALESIVSELCNGLLWNQLLSNRR